MSKTVTVLVSLLLFSDLTWGSSKKVLVPVCPNCQLSKGLYFKFKWRNLQMTKNELGNILSEMSYQCSLMKTFFLAFFLFGASQAHAECSTASKFGKKLIGSWSGIDHTGKEGSLTFNADCSVEIVSGGVALDEDALGHGAKIRWTLNELKKPMWLNIIFSKPSKNPLVRPYIVRFLTCDSVFGENDFVKEAIKHNYSCEEIKTYLKDKKPSALTSQLNSEDTQLQEIQIAQLRDDFGRPAKFLDLSNYTKEELGLLPQIQMTLTKNNK